MARLPFTDAHVHFFDVREPQLHYAWLMADGQPDPILGDHSALKAQRLWADDFLSQTRLHNVERVIHVECAQGIEDPVAETRWLQTFVERLGVPHGIVAQAHLAAPDARETLERHAGFANLRGIRDPDNDAYLSDAWRRGYGLLEELGLVCCHSTFVENMAAARSLAEDFPGITYCVDHAGFPKARDREYFDAWSRGIRTIAAAPNAVVKISGLGMVDHAWTVESIRPWVLECIEAFGTRRSFFATNWPVDGLFSTYGDIVDAYAEIVADLPESDRRALFSENANRIFRLA
jgi:predicted TIM-barrel fold metal-dependent hydrolase